VLNFAKVKNSGFLYEKPEFLLYKIIVSMLVHQPYKHSSLSFIKAKKFTEQIKGCRFVFRETPSKAKLLPHY
jgi:hypothetical protein